MQIPKDGLKDELAPMPIDKHLWHADGVAQVEDQEMGHDGTENAPVAWIEKESPAGEIEEREEPDAEKELEPEEPVLGLEGFIEELPSEPEARSG